MIDSISPELQVGNVEYKLKIVNPSRQRFEHLVTQMNWRLGEGNGEAIYKIGVQDNGTLTGISLQDMNASLETLEKMSAKLDATITIVNEQTLKNCKKIAEVLVRKTGDDQNNTETRVAVLGNADAGKSTLLGVLTQGVLDNGKGRARLNMFRHLHEVRSGRTSSISHEILGFDSEGQSVNYSYNEFMTARKICDISTKLVKFMDLAGHRKYFRTTIQGLTSYSPHLAMLVISATAGAIGMTQEHLTITIALNLNFFIVISKTDLKSPERAMESLELFLKQAGCCKLPYLVAHFNDMSSLKSRKFVDNIIPVFCISSVNGEGMDLLLKFLYEFSPNQNPSELFKKSPEFHIDENFTCGDKGKIIYGLLTKGVIKEGCKMKVGPFKDGSFEDVQIKSIHRNRVPCQVIYAGQSAAMCLEPCMPSLRKGMVLIGSNSDKTSCWYFQSSILVLYHSTAIVEGFQATVHIGTVRQTVVVIEIFTAKHVRTNETATVLFKFKVRPEYVHVGNQMIFRAGTSKGIGKIIKTFPLGFRY